LACDNCIPGDASGWYLPLGLLTLLAVAAAGACVVVARRRGGRRAVPLWVAAAALDRTQRGCKDKGAATMRAAEAYGAASAGVAVLALLVAAVPGGGRPEPALAA
jgi:hypothetical protein